MANARPPSGATALDASMLGWLGGRLLLDDVGPFSIDIAAYGGRSTRSGGGWLNGSLGAESTHRVGSTLASGRVELFGLDFRNPFTYRSHGFVLAPEFLHSAGPYTAIFRGEVVRGSWSLTDDVAVDSIAPGAPQSLPIELDGPLALTGAALTVGRYLGPVWLETTGEAYGARNGELDGTYAALGAAAVFTIGAAGARLGISRWSTPTGAELGVSGSASLELSDGLLAYATVEKSATDPLYGSPGSVTASFGVSWRVTRHHLSTSVPVAEIGEAVDSGRRVRFRLPAGDAERVALTGTFTDWTPRPMERFGGHWVLELVLEPGLHHFVFVLDGEHWYVPDNAPGVVDDGWGRQNASLVVEGE